MKILMISTNRFDRNGMSVFIMNYLTELRKLHVKVDLIASGEIDHQFAQQVKDGGQLFFFLKRNTQPVKYIRFVRQILNRGHYDIVYIHGNSGTVVAEILAARKLQRINKLKVCVHAHGQNTSHPIIHALFRGVVVHWSDQNFAASPAAGNFMFKRNPFTIIPNGIYPKRYSFSAEARRELRNEMQLEESTKLVVQLGAFTPQKNYEFTINLANICKKQGINAHFALFGEGPLKNKYEERVSKFGLENYVSFEGVTSDVSGVLSAADLVIFPSLFEPFGIVALEAQAAGVPIAVSDRFISALNITKLISFLPLNSTSWVNWISNTNTLQNHSDTNFQNEISHSGYNIEDNATDLKRRLRRILNNR